MTQWLIAPPNTKFVEICPERAFQLALALKIPGVLVAAFRILVSELAVDYAAPEPSPRRPPLTWAQRRRDDYGDLPSDPVEYAARAFFERITDQMDILRSGDVFDRIGPGLHEWELLKVQTLNVHRYGSDELKTAHGKLLQVLVGAFHNLIRKCLRDGAPVGRLATLIAAQRDHYISKHERDSLRNLYENLDYSQRVLTPFFWENLRSQASLNGPLSIATYNGYAIKTYVQNYNLLWKAADLPQPDFQQVRDHGDFRSVHHSKQLNEFNLFQFESEVFNALTPFCDKVLGKGYNEEPFQFFLSDHLLLPGANSPEMKFLPLWTPNGCDDGSGGVFQDTVPEAEMGPSEPGPAYHTGFTIPTTGTRTAGTGTRNGDGDDTTMMDEDDRFAGSIYGVSELGDNLDRFEIISARSATTTTQTATVRSMDAQQSVATTSTTGLSGIGRLNLDPGGPNRHRVVAVPSEISSEGFSLNSMEDGEYADAMYTQPTEHQAVGRSLVMFVEGVDGEKPTTTTGTNGSSGAEKPTTATGTSGSSGASTSRQTDEFMLEDDDADGELKDLDSDDGSSTVGADSDYDML